VTDGLRTDQAPPLTVPTRFYLVAPLALVAVGVLLMTAGPAAFATRWSPWVLAVTHLLTLGYLGSILLGSLYQVIPVVAGVPVLSGTRVASAVLVAWVAGVAALVAAFLTNDTALFVVAPALLGAAFLGFGVPVGLALARAPTRNATVWGLRLAVAALVGVVGFGIHAALVRAGITTSRDYLLLVLRHAALGGLVWVGVLLVAVSWQVVPMFYLAPPVPRWSERPTLAAGLVLLLAVLILPMIAPNGLPLAALPAAVAIWGVHPWLTARAIVGRRRKRADFSLRFWLVGLAFGVLTLGLYTVAVFATDPRWALALGWSAAFGWAGLIAHGMLSRIVPFLVWFHRFSPLVGKQPVPSMRELLPEVRLQPALIAHVAAAVAGLLAIAAGWGYPAVGVLVAGTGGLLLYNLVTTLRRRP
jgi:hypothetical protein